MSATVVVIMNFWESVLAYMGVGTSQAKMAIVLRAELEDDDDTSTKKKQQNRMALGVGNLDDGPSAMMDHGNDDASSSNVARSTHVSLLLCNARVSMNAAAWIFEMESR